MLFFALTAYAKSCIRWLDVLKSTDGDVAIVKLEGAKPGDRIFLMENTINGSEKSWEPKCYYTIPENANVDNLELNMPAETQPNHSYALALKNKEGDQPIVYSKPLNNYENQWTPADKNALGKNEAAAADKKQADKNATKKKGTSSANGTTFSIGIACIVLGAMLL